MPPIFEYKALDAKGQHQTGMIDADTSRDARLQLRKSSLHVMEIQQTGMAEETPESAGDMRSRLPWFGGMASEELAMLTRQLATLLRAGIPISDALRALIEQTEDKKVERVLRNIHERITQGKSLADAMALHPKFFNPLYVSMVRAGEATGMMDEVLMRLAVYIQNQSRMQHKIQAALMYPLIMSSVGVVVVFILMKFVVPKITQLVRSSGQGLPLSTQILIQVSSFVGTWWWLLALAAGVMVAVYKIIHATPKGGMAIDAFKLRMWIFGPLLSKAIISRFAVTFSILLRSGVPALQGLRVVKDIVNNKKMAQAIQTIHDRLIEGTDITSPLKQSGVFPPMVAYMIAVGEQSGQLEQILETLADAYDEEVEFAMQRMISLLEPLMIISLAVVVGLIVFSIIMPIMKLSQAI